MVHKTVPPKSYVQRMRNYWIETLDNHTNPDLEKCWEVMCETFNGKILKRDEIWHILQPPTGSGKSQGLCVYCSMLAEDDGSSAPHPGVLIVVRLKQQAEDMANKINELVGREVALAKHSGKVGTPEEVREAQVLVITHKAYQIAIDPASASNQIAFPSYSNWKLGERRLVVIDEALDVVDHFKVTAEDINRTLGYIPYETKRKHPEATLKLEVLLDYISMVLDQSGESVQTRVLWQHGVFGGNVDLSALRKDLKGIRWDRVLERREDQAFRKRKADEINRTLKSAEAIYQRFAYYQKKRHEHTLNTAHLIIPDNLKGPVVLDATASANLLWNLFGDRRVTPPVPPKARRYDNVTIHLSYDFKGVGKSSMVPNAIDRAKLILGDLSKRLDPSSKALIVSHKDAEFAYHGYLSDMSFHCETGHFGALDGRNDWKDFDTVVIAGLPYRDRSWSINSFLALCPMPDPPWFESEDNRPYEKHQDIVKSLQSHQVCVDVIQAINRVRCRKVIDEHGNCQPTNIYITVKADLTGEDLRQALRSEMPGAKIVQWHIEDAAKALGPRNHAELFYYWVLSAMPGSYSMSSIQKALGLPANALRSLRNQLGNPKSSLRRRLPDIQYKTTGAGRARRSFVVVPG